MQCWGRRREKGVRQVPACVPAPGRGLRDPPRSRVTPKRRAHVCTYVFAVRTESLPAGSFLLSILFTVLFPASRCAVPTCWIDNVLGETEGGHGGQGRQRRGGGDGVGP